MQHEFVEEIEIFEIVEIEAAELELREDLVSPLLSWCPALPKFPI